jgi:hypothetical protein
MPGPVEATGAQRDATRYGALNMGGEQFTGIWTQRSPYRDAATAYLIKKFYQGSRFDSILDGINREISARLTDVRRPGCPVWNSNTFSAIDGFYSFKFVQNGQTVIRVLADTATAVYDVTAGGNTLIWTKSAGAGRTRFLSVGPTLYMSNGVDNIKWLQSALAWQPTTLYSAGQYVVDTNGNMQVAISSQTPTIVAIQITHVGGAFPYSRATLFFSPSTPLTNLVNETEFTLAGLTTVPGLNGASYPTFSVNNPVQVTINIPSSYATLAYSPETGTATTGNGQSGATQPTWAALNGQVTQDQGAQWVNRGSTVQQWAYPGPTTAPTVTQVQAPNAYPARANSTYYGNPLVIVDSNGNCQQLKTGGTTAAAHPAWAVTVGAVTTEAGGVQWTCLGAATWAASTAYALGAVVQVTFSYWITQAIDLPYAPYYQLEQVQVSVTVAFQCTVAGTSGASAPNWTNGQQTSVTDNTVTWISIGAAPAWPASSLVSTVQKIENAGYLYIPQSIGQSGGAPPATWLNSTGSITTDGSISWLCIGPFAPANTGAWTWAYSGLNTITGDISTASPISQSVLLALGNQAVIQGLGVASQYDQIILWRTAQGQSFLLYDAQFPNPGPGQTWIFTDTTPDLNLNAFIAAPVASANNPPPIGITAPTYHEQRIWYISGGNVGWTGGPDTVVGNGNDTFPPLNFLTPPAQAVKLRPITVQNGGLLVYTTSGIQIILGTGTAANPFYMTSYAEKIALAGYDCEDILGSQLYLMESNLKVSTITVEYPFNPQSGYSEIGFPIGDQFKKVTTGGISSALYSAAGSYLSWNIASSGDTGMYVSDGAVGWFRMSTVSTPESGLVWSPRAAVVGGTSAVQSIETAPGVFNLLIGPASSGPILYRDTTGSVFGDGASDTAYPAWDVKGVIMLCTTGQWTEVAHISTKSAAVGARPAISTLLGEIAPTANRPWNPLLERETDPINTPVSQSAYCDRYKMASNGRNNTSDTIMVKFDYGSQTFGDELMDWGIFASTSDERKEEAAPAR